MQERRDDDAAEAAFFRHHDMAPPAAKRQKLGPRPASPPLMEIDDDLPPDFNIVVRLPPPQEPRHQLVVPDSPAQSATSDQADAPPPSTAATSDATGSTSKPMIPGPAGALPPLTRFVTEDLDRTFENFMQQFGNDTVDPDGRASTTKAFRNAAARQLENKHDFGRGAWVEMLHHEKWHPFSDADLPPKKMECSIAWILEQGYRAKIKCLFVLIKRLQVIDDDAYAVLRDPTGEINATIHYRAMDLYRELTDGAVLWLEDLSVLSESTKSHHLIITTRNIRFLWPVFTTTKAKLPHKFVHTNVRPASKAVPSALFSLFLFVPRSLVVHPGSVAQGK
jgi:hypothetical protein